MVGIVLPSPGCHRLFLRRQFFLFGKKGVVTKIVEEEKADETDEDEKQQPESSLDKIEQELPSKADSCPELKGNFSGFRRLRIGDYRIIFVIIDDTVLITRIRNRKDVYRK